MNFKSFRFEPYPKRSIAAYVFFWLEKFKQKGQNLKTAYSLYKPQFPIPCKSVILP